MAKRMHIGLNVVDGDDLDAAVDFYTRLFGHGPTLQRDDYVKWMLDDPLVNVSITTSADEPNGVSHLGIQLDSVGDLDIERRGLDQRSLDRSDQNDLVCGYQRQDKSWVFDPSGMPWEVFVTHGREETYGTNEMPVAT